MTSLAKSCSRYRRGRSRFGARRIKLTMKLPVPVQGSMMNTSGLERLLPNSFSRTSATLAHMKLKDLLRRIDDAVRIRDLHGIPLKEALVHRVQEVLLSGVFREGRGYARHRLYAA